MLYPSNKEKKRKEILNNNLAILPSHDTSSVFVSTSTSSTNTATFPLFIKSLKISFIIAWNIAGEFVIPKNITISLKEPMCVMNVPFYSSPSFILTLLNSHLRSILVNTFLLPMLSINSVINGSK